VLSSTPVKRASAEQRSHQHTDLDADERASHSAQMDVLAAPRAGAVPGSHAGSRPWRMGVA
jgi:hypothetical protein